MTSKFKSRYVLAEGYPLHFVGEWKPAISMETSPFILDGKTVQINWPKELDDNDLPPYRLVLERVE